MASNLKNVIEDHSLEMVPDGERKNWLSLTWNTAGIVTTLVILFFGALVCFVAGVKIALLAGLICFGFGSLLGWGLSHIAYSTGLSNTLVTRQFGLGVKGSVLASVIFSFLIIGMLALENALLYRGVLFFFELTDTLGLRILIYGIFTCMWILVTTFGFRFIAKFSFLMLTLFLLVLGWILGEILLQAKVTTIDMLLFNSQFPDEALLNMGVQSNWDKFVFSINILIGPACALPLVSIDYGRYAKSAAHATTAVLIGSFFQSVIVTLIGGVLMYASADGLVTHFMNTDNLSMAEARKMILGSPDSIAATFMIFGGVIGFILMIVAQAKAQVLNCYSASLSLANLCDALFEWRPGRFIFVVVANVIALLMLYGHILELVEAWVSLLGVLLSTLSGIILMDYFITKPIILRRSKESHTLEKVNWAGVITIILSVLLAHYVLPSIIAIEAISSCLVVACVFPLLRLYVFQPVWVKNS